MNSSRNEYVGLPEGLPPEHAEAYLAGYERARRGAEPTVRVERGKPWEGEPTQAIPRTDPPANRRPEPARQVPRPAVQPARQVPHPAPRKGSTDEPPRRRAVWPVLLVVASLLAVVVAFGIGRLLADGGPTGPADPAAGESATGERGQGAAERAPYDGPVEAVTVSGASATCQAPDSVDEAGNPISYPPASAVDADVSTAWRCAGPANGQALTLEVPEGTQVAEVGLLPGYAKSDPVTGADRYAENNRITRVRWSFEDGTSYVQRMEGDPQDRSLRTRRVPATATGTVTLEVLASAPGPRNTIAVSEVRVAAAAG